MSNIIVLENNKILKQISIKKRCSIKQKEIQELLKKYLDNTKYKFKCSCKNEDIPMHLKSKNYITISSNPNFTHKHAQNCIFNSKIIELYENYYIYEKDIFTTNIFLDKTSIGTNEGIEHDNFTCRLSSTFEDIDKKEIPSKNYIRYKNYNDFCILILKNTLKKFTANPTVESFIRTCKGVVFNSKIRENRKNITVSNYLNEIKKKFQFYFNVKILDDKSEIFEMTNYCSNNSQKEFLNDIYNNSNPILMIYFIKNSKITSLFAIDIKLILETKEDLNKKNDFEEKLSKQNILLKSNIINKNENEKYLIYLANEFKTIQVSQKELKEDIKTLDNKISDLNTLPDKKWLFFKNNTKFEDSKKLNRDMKSLKENLIPIENLINMKNQEIQNLNIKINKLGKERIITRNSIKEIEEEIKKGFLIKTGSVRNFVSIR